MDRSTLTTNLKTEARRLGFGHSGVCPAVEPAGLVRFDQWLSAGYAGRMRYLPDRAEAYRHPRHVLQQARSILVLGMDYRTADPVQPVAGQGRVSRYAWGTADYHDLIRQRLEQLAAFLRRQVPGAQARGVVDTEPLLERELGRLAGLGWIGKNTLLLTRRAGSWFFLSALLTDVQLDYDRPYAADYCGNCRACLDACPTRAFVQPYVLDARRCVSYLTIELRESIPEDLREGLGHWLFGCDLCQEACPFNRRSTQSEEPAFEPREDTNPMDLVPLYDLDDEGFRRRFRHTPLWRSKRRGILRNAAIVLGNRPTGRATDALVRGLGDGEPLVRGACAWALGKCRNSRSKESLLRQLQRESDDEVQGEIKAALADHAD